jgi:polysaccharide biosynthesis protein PslG
MTRHRRTLALLVSLALVGCAAITFASLSRAQRASPRARAAAVPAGDPIVGLIAGTAEWSNPTIGDRLNQVVSSTDAKWLREGFFWSRIEPSPGRFDFGHYDRFMVLAARRHEHVLALLYTAPQWAAATPNALPSNPSAYADFVAAVVHRYGPSGSLWAKHPNLRAYAINTFDLWNEPYYDIGNNGDYNPARYAKLVKAAGAAGHAADPSAKLLMGAEMQGQMVRGSWRWWVDAMYRAVPDLNRYFDGVSVHPYGHDIRGLAPAIPNRQYFGYTQMRRIEIIRRQFVRHGAANKPFWSTEVGWPTCTHGTDRCVSPAGQVASLEALLRYSRTIWKGYMRAVFVYYYDDGRGSRSDPENDYGLTYSNHAPKPVLGVFRAFARSASVTAWPSA